MDLGSASVESSGPRVRGLFLDSFLFQLMGQMILAMMLEKVEGMGEDILIQVDTGVQVIYLLVMAMVVHRYFGLRQ